VGGGGNAPKTAAGYWRRVNSAKGLETDVAFGAIRDEPANRVLMCELPPSPTQGLYTGTLINPTLIRWDSKFNLPDYEVVFLGDYKMSFKPEVTGEVFLGEYIPGVWRSGSCGYLNVENEIGLSKWSAWVEATSSQGTTVTGVKVDGVALPTSASLAPTCPGGALPPPRKSGIRDVTISLAIDGIPQTVNATVAASEFKEGCNRIAARTGSVCGAAAACVSVGDAPSPALEAILTTVSTDSLPQVELTADSVYAIQNGFLMHCALGGCGSSPTAIPIGAVVTRIRAHQGKLFLAMNRAVPRQITMCVASGASCAPTLFASTSTYYIRDVSAAGGWIYWLEETDAAVSSIWVCPVTGCSSGYPKKIHTLPSGVPWPAMAVSDAAIFITDGAQIFRLPLTTPEVVNVAGVTTVYSLAMPGRMKQLSIDAANNLWWMEVWPDKLSNPDVCGNCYTSITVLRSCALPACDSVTERGRITVPTGGPWSSFQVNATHVYGGISGFFPGPASMKTQNAGVWRFQR